MTACPDNPPSPSGYRIWRAAVPKPLSDWAVSLKDNEMRAAAYGSTWTLNYGGQLALARKDHHTWTYRKGELITGICIPGITLYAPIPVGSVTASSSSGDDLRVPDPSAALYSEDRGTDWVLVGMTAVAAAATVTAFWLGIKLAGGRRAR